jgi:3-oxoacyl-(acyl-carrier-protein) synthase
LVAAVAHVEAGLLEHALVLGVEVYNDVTALGFQGLGLLGTSIMKPFDSSRGGLVLGEGVSAIVVGHDRGDRRAPVFLRGSASLCDPYGISASAPDGSTIRQVMELALESANLSVHDIAAVKVHGTASLSNDEAESAGMLQLFERLPPVCAIKPFIGHTLGACGLNELILFYRALEAGFLIATPGIATTAEALGVQLNQRCDPMAPGNFMLNYFGFGGNNCSLIIGNQAEVGQ